MSAAPLDPSDDDRSPLLAAWCGTCKATQPCTSSRDNGKQPASPPYRCFSCGQIVANPVIRIRSRRTFR